MSWTRTDVDAWALAGMVGPARQFTAVAAARANLTAFPSGRYLFSVETGAIRILGPVATRAAALAVAATDHRLVAGATWSFVVDGGQGTRGFVGVIRDTADSIFTVTGHDPFTSATQPSDFGA